MRGRRRADRWATEEQRAAISRALLEASLPASLAPPGYESTRGELWVEFQAARTVPAWDDFESDMGDLRSILWPLIDHHVIWDTTGELDAFLSAAGALQRAWDAGLGVALSPVRELTTDGAVGDMTGCATQQADGSSLEIQPPVGELIDWLRSRMAHREPSAMEVEEAAASFGMTNILRGSLAAPGGSYKALAFAEPDRNPKAGGVVLWRVRDGLRSGPWYFQEHRLARPKGRR